MRLRSLRSRAQLHRAVRARYCVHRVAADADPLAVAWPRELVCVNCGASVDPTGYVAEPGTALRRRAEGSAAQ